MSDWYRRKTWNETDEKEFFTKLNLARKDSRAQYLRIQAVTLIDTKLSKLLTIAEKLLLKMLSDYPENKFERSSTLCSLGNIYKERGDFEKAIKYYQQSFKFEIEYPNVRTSSYLEYSELIVKTRKTEKYAFVESLLLKKIDDLMFPIDKYRVYSLLAIISHYRNKSETSKHYAKLADENANAETSGFRYHKYLGIVKERINWLDKLAQNK